MNYNHCCGADRLFDLKGAQKEMKKFRKKGTDKSTNLLLNKLAENGIANKTLLDIGGGIGAIQWFFLRHGAAKTMDVDASTAYLRVAEDYAIENGWREKCNFESGDFSLLEKKIEDYDYVTLNKVVCCYPDYRSLLQSAIKSCKDQLALTFPIRNILSRMLVFLSGLYFRFKKNPFRTYNHSPREIELFIRSNGFEPVFKSIRFPWHVQIYMRVGKDKF